jgi:hypothetical protein
MHKSQKRGTANLETNNEFSMMNMLNIKDTNPNQLS